MKTHHPSPPAPGIHRFKTALLVGTVALGSLVLSRFSQCGGACTQCGSCGAAAPLIIVGGIVIYVLKHNGQKEN